MDVGLLGDGRPVAEPAGGSVATWLGRVTGFVLFILVTCVVVLEPNQYGIRKNLLTGYISDRAERGGIHFVGPLKTFFTVPAAQGTLQWSWSDGDRAPVHTRTGADPQDPDSGGQPISISCAVQVKFVPELIQQVYLSFGSFQAARERYLLLAGNVVSNTAQEYTPTDFWTKRRTISDRMLFKINHTLWHQGYVEAMQFEIMKVDFAKQFEDSITAVQVAEQAKVVNEYEQQVQRVVQHISVLQSENQATIANISAGAEAKSKEIKAAARRDAFMLATQHELISASMVALSFVAVNTVTVLVVASHLWWARSSGYQKYADIVSLMKERRDLSTRRAQLMAEKASFKLFNIICKIYLQFSLLLNTFSALVMTNSCGAGEELHLLLTIALYAAGVAVAMDLVPLTPKNCDQIALWAHCLLLISLWCPSSDVDFLMMGGGRSLLRALTSLLFVGNLRKALAANLVLSLGSVWSLTKAAQALQGGTWSCHVLSAAFSEISCTVQLMFLVLVVRRLVDEWLELKLENLDISGKSHARRNLLSVLVDADITLDSNLRICAPSNKAQHLLAPDLQTSLEGLKFHHLVAEADRSKLREFLNRAGYAAASSETADLRSESSTSMQGGGGSPASSMSIQMGETGRLLQIFHASIPVAEGEEMKKQPRHLVGIQEQFSAQEFSETTESNNLYMDPTTDAEQVYLSTQNLAAQQQSFEGRQRRPPSTGSRGSRDSRGSASSASSLRSSVAGLPEISSISFIFNGYSEGLSIVEATLRFDTFRGEKSSEPARLPEMRHWIRSRHWDQFRNWVQMETQRCCAGHADEVKSFEGPLEFYYPGQPDMTLVAGSVNVMGIQNDWDSDNEDDEEEDEEPEESKPRHPIKILKRSLTQDSAQESQPKVCEAPSGGSTDSMGVNASSAATEEEEEEALEEAVEEVPFQHPLLDQEAEAEVDALLVEVECKAFSQYRRLNSKPRKSKRYGHLCRNRPLEPSLDAIPERP